jgi:limonene-1,2-epoxide hydrolase
MTPTETVLQFIDAINAQNINKIVGLLTPEHRFTDSLGKVIDGRRHVRDAWQGYLAIVPDYRIEVTETYADGPRVVVLGTAAGTYLKDCRLISDRSWKIPAAWRGVVADGRLSEWQAYVDHEPLRKAMQGSRPPQDE